MKVFRTIDEAASEAGGAVIAVGNFDGVHEGHRVIIATAIDRARQVGSLSMIVTFDPHPRQVLGKNVAFSVLTSLEEKIHLIGRQGADALLIIPFTEAFARIEPELYVREIYVDRLGVREAVVGYSHAFGHRGRGNTDLLKTLGARYGFTVQVVPPLNIEGEIVNSSKIKAFLSEGRVCDAARLLGRRFRITGMVVPGEGRGRKLQFPTANLDFDGVPYLIPRHGVYAVEVLVDDRICAGVMNIGVRPTFGSDRLSCEVHILDFEERIYGKRMSVEFSGYIRDEKKFPTLALLQEQIGNDIVTARRMLNTRPSGN